MEGIVAFSRPLISASNKMIGLLVMMYLAHKWSNYLQTLHENDMWFSNIKVFKFVFNHA